MDYMTLKEARKNGAFRPVKSIITASMGEFPVL